MKSDFNEAFKHNSCKKLAQLIRVVTEFDSFNFDHKIEYLNEQNNFDVLIAEQVMKFKSDLHSIVHNTVTHRKGEIDISCKNFGILYKQIKSNFSNIMNEKYIKINDISKELKELNHIIREITKQSLRFAKDNIDLIDNFPDFIKNKLENIDNFKEFENKYLEILNNINLFQKNFDENMKIVKFNHLNNKKEIQKQIQIILFE